MNKLLSIAIDGPAAAGKSTIAKLVAKELNYIYIDTGAMYRALTYFAEQRDCSPLDELGLLTILLSIEIEFQNGPHGQEILVNGENVTDVIRTPEVARAVPFVSQHYVVRNEMVRRQKQLARLGGVVMDGRDVGTEVMPDAEVKIFMTASVEQRALRRHRENLQKGFPSSLEDLMAEIAARDKADTERTVSPLRKADDAVELDTTQLSIDEATKKILKLVELKRQQRKEQSDQDETDFGRVPTL